jgi:hypothetical protein
MQNIFWDTFHPFLSFVKTEPHDSFTRNTAEQVRSFLHSFLILIFKILEFISLHCNPKEVFLLLMEALDEKEDHIKLLVVKLLRNGNFTLCFKLINT